MIDLQQAAVSKNLFLAQIIAYIAIDKKQILVKLLDEVNFKNPASTKFYYAELRRLLDAELYVLDHFNTYDHNDSWTDPQAYYFNLMGK
jgi:hypothetical protein